MPKVKCRLEEVKELLLLTKTRELLLFILANLLLHYRGSDNQKVKYVEGKTIEFL